jgi:hypothetical protein
MSWLSVIIGLIRIAGQITQYLHDKNMMDAGGLAAIQEVLRGQSDDLARIRAKMANAGADFDSGRGMPEYRPDGNPTDGGSKPR